MFWKNRNVTGILILLVATLLWTWGGTAISDSNTLPGNETTIVIEATTTAAYMGSTTFVDEITSPMSSENRETVIPPGDGSTAFPEDTTSPTTYVTEETTVTDHVIRPTATEDTASATDAGEEATSYTLVPDDEHRERNGRKAWGISACILGALLGIIGVFVLPQKKAVLGPDGIVALCFLGSWGYGYVVFTFGGVPTSLGRFITALFFLLSVRILWGWCLLGFSAEQCLLRRLAKKISGEGKVLLLYLGWTLLATLSLGIYGFTYAYTHHWIFYGAGAVTVCFGIFFLWKYAMELQHFKKQLDNYRRELPIEVRTGTFSQTEAQLVQIRKEHGEALQTAVMAERFKVDLIANVSHDLRTPLTSIVGYTELLEKEELSPRGKEQLTRLREKSVYMNELVESLFELTKVESGAIEPKKEELDIVRLLEQTVGFLDDRLQETDLEIRRRYAGEEIRIRSDGGMLHRIFANLLGNALKYGLPGTRIYLDLVEEEDSVQIRVVNTANYEMDFSEEEIVQRFARGDKARSTRGSGLGLAIAQTYTVALDGSFRVKVDGDQFSAFVTLPKTESDL